ncbi:MAG: LPS export ABC transporter ATP-binding protein [Nitrospinota bacterium]
MSTAAPSGASRLPSTLAEKKREDPGRPPAPAAEDGAERLRVEGLVKSYGGRRVVDGVSLSVGRGEVVGLLGPNGAGKTTAFYIMVGLVRPEAGRVFLTGEEVTHLPMYLRARRGLAYLPQEPSVFRRLSVEDNILAILETYSLPAAERRRRAQALLEDFNIYHIRKTKGYALSGGERRRVEICRALVTSPDFFLLDEPFAGIDPIVVSDIQNIVVRLKDRGIGVLITDHNVRETLRITDRAYVISEGRILESGEPLAIARSERVRKLYLGEEFRL